MPKQNRPTDSFGGPPMRGNNISLVLVLAALTFFAVLQWTTRGEISPAPATSTAPALATVAAGTGASTPTAAEVAEVADADTDAGDATAPIDLPTAGVSPTNVAAQETQPRDESTPTAVDQPTPTANAPPTPTVAAPRASDLPTIAYGDLPPEAHDTIALIASDGPFPFDRDGVTFQNRERILPRHPAGYYREYTVITPGSRDRGARRIVTGEEGEMYYTDDHYASFREIVR